MHDGWKRASVSNDIEHAIVGPSVFSNDEIKIATECGALLKENYSQARNETYLSNTCPSCKSMTGDWFLHHYYDQELMETGIPVGTICLSCEQKEIQEEPSPSDNTISVKVGDKWIEIV
jgi:hypothetical protein